MLATLALSAFESVLNEWIDLDAATRQGFDQLAGKLLRVQMDAPHLSIDTMFDQGRIRLTPTPVGMDDYPASSMFEQRPYDAKQTATPATATLSVPHMVALARLLGATPGTTGNLPVQGDMALLQSIQQVMAQAEPDIAGKLSPWIGDTLAGQLGALLSQGKHALQRTSASLFSHAEDTLKEDSGLLAPRWQAERFIDGVRDLRNDVERLQARLRGLPTSSNDDEPTTPSSTESHASQQQ
jgi:ubiquinone biosynthesis protein UbiJ